MRAATLAALLLLVRPAAFLAQDVSPSEGSSPEPTKSFFLARTAESIQAPYIGTLHYLEFFQIRNRWIYPDIGYVDFAHNDYREFFIGGGRTLYEGKWASWDQELLYVQGTGPAAGSARYLQPWTMVRFFFTPKLSSETVYFAYFPISDSAKFHHVIERAKLEYALKRHWKIGAGYAGLNFPGEPWQSRPLITTTILTKEGDFEFWLQRIPGGGQVQLRYFLVHASR